MNDPTANAPGEATRLADGLKDAFAALAAADVAVEDKARWQQRLLAITNASKHGVVRALERLEAYWRDWEAWLSDAQSGNDETDR